MTSKKPSRKILVVRRENIGDLILTTPLITLLRTHLPDAYIAALVNSYNAPVLAGNCDIDDVFIYTKGKHADSWWGSIVARYQLVRLFVALRGMQFDDVILAEPTYTPRNIRLARFILGDGRGRGRGRGRGGRRVVGFEHDNATYAGLDFVVAKTAIDGLHQAQIMLRVAEAYNIALPVDAMRDAPTCRVGPAADGDGARQSGPLPGAPLPGAPLQVGLHISARKPSQRWPVTSFAALVSQIQQRGAVKFSVFWSPGAADNALHPGDDEKADALRLLLATTPADTAAVEVEFVQTQDLASLIRSLDDVDLLVCADGGAMHIAAGLDKPIVALFGDSDPIRWRPWGVPYRMLQASSRDVADLSVPAVLTAFDELLAECGLLGKIRHDKRVM